MHLSTNRSRKKEKKNKTLKLARDCAIVSFRKKINTGQKAFLLEKGCTLGASRSPHNCKQKFVPLVNTSLRRLKKLNWEE